MPEDAPDEQLGTGVVSLRTCYLSSREYLRYGNCPSASSVSNGCTSTVRWSGRASSA